MHVYLRAKAYILAYHALAHHHQVGIRWPSLKLIATVTVYKEHNLY